MFYVSNRLSYTARFCMLSLLILVSSCAQKSDTQDATGDIMVQVGVQTSASSYALQIVQLNGIEKLNEVSGSFVRFFYSPGSENDQLVGTSPHANFVRTKSFFAPSDLISMQMATIYYHTQNLANFDKFIGAAEINQWPRAVGLETQITDNSSGIRRNNAFYNGQTDSMMFVPFSSDALPIAMNAGIIAHEHFHSLFYKIVIKPAAQSKKISTTVASIHQEEVDSPSEDRLKMTPPKVISEKERAQIFNETFLRGINEGLADFWGWVYTDDPEFMRWSLPQFQTERTLQLQEQQIGVYETSENITGKISEMVQLTDDPKNGLINYAYQVGTPYARFLKQFSILQAESKKIALGDSKKIVSQIIFNYLKQLSTEVQKLEENEKVQPQSLFNFVVALSGENKLVKLDQKSCEFLIKYINLSERDEKKWQTCKDLKENGFSVAKP